MSSTPLSNYPEDLIISKGALNLDSALWASIIKSRPAYVHGADIQKIEHYKCTDGFEHEYLAMHIKHPLNDAASGRKIVIFVERTVTPSISNLFLSSPTSPPPIPANDIISISSPNVPDPIKFITENHKSHILISYLEFDNNPPTDTDLSRLLDFVAQEHPQYDLKFQCYWLASFLYDAFQDLFKGKSNDTEHASKRGHFGKVPAPSKDKWANLKAKFESFIGAPENI